MVTSATPPTDRAQKLEQIRAKLLPTFRRGVSAKRRVLGRALAEMRRGDAAAEETIRRLAHQLRGTGSSYGAPEVSVAAAAVEEAPEGHLERPLLTLLEVLRGVAEGTDRTPTRVLFVDDDLAMRQLAAEALGSAGLIVLPAKDADEARAHLSVLDFDCVVLDLCLGEVDGREILTELREQSPTLPVIVVTARTETTARAECLALGATQVFVKPLDLELLGVAVDTSVERTRRLSEEARVDALTGLPNRRAFEVFFDEQQARRGRTEAPMCLAVIDLDRFKDVNDTYGHTMGDEVLRTTADVLVKTFREGDMVARWGGEEMTVLFVDTTLENANRALDRARGALSSTSFESAPELRVTFSAGLTEVAMDEQLTHAFAGADARLYHAKAAGRDRVTSEIPATAPRPRILIADDDALMIRSVRGLLVRAGYEVVACEDGDDALERAKRESFALVILDGQMPRMDGFTTLAALRQLPGYRRVPMMMLTSLGEDEHVEHAFECGADDYLEKPFNPRQLRARLRRMLVRSGVRQAAITLASEPPEDMGSEERSAVRMRVEVEGEPSKRRASGG
ncbi:MAG: response regulator [Myxococcota bacterium]|nr:response regulator [Myxococcota bacterium]